MVNREVTTPFRIVSFFTAFGFEYAEDFVFKGERHDFWEVNFIKGGEATITRDENVFDLHGGNMIFHAPMQFHRIMSANGTRPTGYTFTFGTVGTLPDEIKRGFFYLNSKQLNEIEKIMSYLIPFVNNEENDMYDGQLVSSMLSAFIIKLARESSKNKEQTTQGAIEYRQIVNLMKEKLSENLTLSQIAEQRNISVSYVKQLFSRFAGVSPIRYYTELRASEAARLINGGLSVSEVAEKMNFSSPSYLSSFFKKHFGLSPAKYKQRN